MRIDIHLPRGMTAGELTVVVIATMREAERQRRATKRENHERDKERAR